MLNNEVEKKCRFPNGLIVAVGGCSAVGKSTVIDQICAKINAEQAYSVTTRPLRGPDDKRQLVSLEEFQEMLRDGKLIEGICYGGNYYGISKQAVSDILKQGKVAVLDCNLSGVKQLLQTDLAPKVITVFLVCSAEELFRRQMMRGAGTAESRQYRLRNALVEIDGADDPNFDFIVKNDDVNDAAEKIIRIIEGHGDSDFFSVADFKRDLTTLIEDA